MKQSLPSRVSLLLVAVATLLVLLPAASAQETCAGTYDSSDGTYKSTGQDKCPNGYNCLIDEVETPVDGVSYDGICIEDACSKPGNDALAPKVTICHRSCANANNPWIRVTMDQSSWESSCQHADHVVADCNAVDTSPWGAATGDYLLKEHDPQVWANDHQYRKEWTSSCPAVQNGKCCVGADCCTGDVPEVTTVSEAGTTPYCPPDVGVYEAGYSVEWEGSGEPPIALISRTPHSVTFSVTNVWGSGMETLYTQYERRASDGAIVEDCPALVGTGSGGETETFTAACSEHAQTAIVFLYVSDTTFDPLVDTAVIPDCCYPDENDTNGKRKLTIVLQCTDPCPDEEEDARTFLRKAV